MIAEKLSDHHLLSDVAATYVGMDIAVPDACWEPYRAVGKPFRQGADEVGSSSQTRALSQEEAWPEKAATPQEKRTTQSPHLDRPRTLETSEEITLKGVAGGPY